MKYGDFYKHYKGGEYWFQCIALPMTDLESDRNIKWVGQARYHENDKDINLFFQNGVWFVDYDLPCVIYQAEKDRDTEFVWAREVDDFFGYKTEGTTLYKRFVYERQN